MRWIMRVDPLISKVPWNEKVFNDRDQLQLYLEYFGIENDYTGPGRYLVNKDSCNSNWIEILFGQESENV